MRATLGLLILLGAVLSGCITGESSPDSQATPTGPEMHVDPNSEFGLVKGTVVNDETEPIAGAMVGLMDTEFNTTTREDGFFGIANVPPGTYTLVAAAIGYGAAAVKIEVTAGQETQATLTLLARGDPDLVHHEVIPFSGFFECALGAYAWVSSCTYPYTAVYLTAKDEGVNLTNYGLPPDLQKNVHRFNFTVRQGVGEVYAELSWRAGSAAAQRMQMILMCGDYQPVWDDCLYPNSIEGHSIRYNSSSGTSPVVVRVSTETFHKEGKDQGKHDLAKNSHIWVMNYVGLPFGCLTTNVNNLTSQCPSRFASGWQVAFQQRFEVWDTVFYNSVAPDGYTALPDS